jgi:hypothetical protein
MALSTNSATNRNLLGACRTPSPGVPIRVVMRAASSAKRQAPNAEIPTVPARQRRPVSFRRSSAVLARGDAIPIYFMARRTEIVVAIGNND